jgi:hypothetical protein
MPLGAEYERMAEDAVLALWDELSVEQVKLLEKEMPRLVEFLAHLHHSISHEEAMVRGNCWAERSNDVEAPE